LGGLYGSHERYAKDKRIGHVWLASWDGKQNLVERSRSIWCYIQHCVMIDA